MSEQEQNSVEAQVVEAVATAAGSGMTGRKGLEAKLIEYAMVVTVQQCYDEGLANDPDKIRERIAVARGKIKAFMQSF